MLIHRVDAATLSLAERLNAEVAGKLASARTTSFSTEAEAEACLQEVVALMQQQAAITARILTAAIDERNARRAEHG